MLWLVTLPLVLFKFFGFGSIGVSFVVSYLILGVEAVGTEVGCQSKSSSEWQLPSKATLNLNRRWPQEPAESSTTASSHPV